MKIHRGGAKQEDFEHAEERRLFYVLLTRAKEEVYLVASLNSRSFFSIELENPGYIIEHIYPNGSKPRLCPTCQNGMMVIRRNAKGENFLGCSNYPKCSYTKTK